MKRSRSPIRYVRELDETDLIHDLLGLPETPDDRSDEQVAKLAKHVVGKLPVSEYTCTHIITDVALEMPTKHFVLTYLLKAISRQGEYGRDLCKCVLTETAKRVGDSLKSGRPVRAKQGIRFLLCCSAHSVLSCQAAASIVTKLVDTALGALDRSKTKGKHTLWNYAYYAEYLVYCVLVCLPAAASAFQTSGHKDLLVAILAKVEVFMANRSGKMKTSSLSLRKDAYSTLGIDAACSTAGIVGRVNWIWSAYQEDGATSADFEWAQVEAVAHYPVQAEEAKAEGEGEGMAMEGDANGGNGVDAEPKAAPGASITEEEVAMKHHELIEKSDRYLSPAIAHCDILPKQHTRIGKFALNRVLVEEYALDLLTLLSMSPGKLVEYLANLPIGKGLAYESVLSEAVFAHMLHLPTQDFAPIFYSGVISDLCMKMKSFPKYMSACVRYLVEGIETVDVECMQRIARWQAYHLSAFQFQWPWDRWGWTNFATHGEASRTKIFIQDLFVRLQRLAYYDHIIKRVPTELSSLVDQAQAKPNKDLDGQGDDGEKKVDMMMQLILKKKTSEELMAYGFAEKESTLPKSFVIAVLCMGGKSFTHMRTLLKRYRKVINLFLEKSGAKFLDVLFRVWEKSPEKFLMAFSCTLEAGIVNDVEALKWAVEDETRSLVTQRARIHWEVVESSLGTCCALCRTGASSENRDFYSEGIKFFWAKLFAMLDASAGAAPTEAEALEKEPWLGFGLRMAHGLLRKHSAVLGNVVGAIAAACETELVRRQAVGGLECFRMEGAAAQGGAQGDDEVETMKEG